MKDSRYIPSQGQGPCFFTYGNLQRGTVSANNYTQRSYVQHAMNQNFDPSRSASTYLYCYADLSVTFHFISAMFLKGVIPRPEA